MARDSFQVVFHAIKASQAYAQFEDPDIASNLFTLLDSLERDLVGSYTPSERSEESADAVEGAIQDFLEAQEETEDSEEKIVTIDSDENEDEEDTSDDEDDEDDEDEDLLIEEESKQEDAEDGKNG